MCGVSEDAKEFARYDFKGRENVQKGSSLHVLGFVYYVYMNKIKSTSRCYIRLYLLQI